jgi:hypothetical protein
MVAGDCFDLAACGHDCQCSSVRLGTFLVEAGCYIGSGLYAGDGFDMERPGWMPAPENDVPFHSGPAKGQRNNERNSR